jgi:hypothetical protein
MTDINIAARKEFYLNVNDFGEVASYEGILAIAKQLQTLILLLPKSYPSHPDMGVGIENYLMEFGDNTTLSELNTRISEQVSKYLPSTYINSVEVDYIVNDITGVKDTIAVKADISIPNEADSLILTFEKETTTSNIVSKLYI